MEHVLLTKQFYNSLFLIEKDVFVKSATQSLNRTARGVRTDAKRNIADRLHIKRGDAAKGIKIKKATKNNLEAEAIPSIKPYPLSQFQARPAPALPLAKPKRGISAKVFGKRRIYTGSFYAYYKKSGKAKHVYRRQGKARLPIEKLYGPSIHSLFKRDEMQKIIDDSIALRFPKEWIMEIPMYLLH